MKDETASLKEAILVLQKKRATDLMLLKHQWHITYEGFKPVNLIKTSIKEAVFSADIKGNIVSNLMGIGAGIISRKIWVGGSSSPVKKLFGTLIQFAVANLVSKHSDGIKTAGKNILVQLGKNTVHVRGTDPERENNY